jgi:chromate transporter
MGSHISPATTPFIENPSFRDALAVWAKNRRAVLRRPGRPDRAHARNLVDERRWIAEDRFLHALNFCMLLPGPEAMQLATYIGWRLPRASSLCCPEPRSCSP